MFVPTPPPSPSTQAQELGEQLALFVHDYRELHPGLSPLEIERAFTVARSRIRSESTADAPRLLPAVMFTLLVLGVGVFVLFGLVGLPRTVTPQSWILIAIGVVAVLAGVVAAAGARR